MLNYTFGYTHRCTVYISMGTHIGIQTRKLDAPEMESPVLTTNLSFLIIIIIIIKKIIIIIIII